MTTTILTDELDPRADAWKRPSSPLTFKEQQIRDWRARARFHFTSGDMDLARDCERNAIFWEDRA